MSFEEEAKLIEASLTSSHDPSEVRSAVEAAISLAGPWADEANLLKAAELMDRAAEAAGRIDEPRLAAYVLDQKAQLLTQFDLPAEALQDIDRAIQAVAGDEAVEQDLKVRRTVVLAKMGRVSEAISQLGAMIETLEAAGADDQRLRLLGLLGNYHLRAGQNKQAQAIFEQAIAIGADSTETSQLARFQLGLSQALAGQEKYQAAQTILLEQLLIATTSDLAIDTWDLLGPAIEVSHQLQDWPTLAKLTHQAIELASRQGDYKDANMHRENLISVLMRQGQLREAKAQLEIALDYARRKGPAERKLVHLMSLGRVCFDLGELESSEKYYQEALEAADRQGHQRSTITILGRMGALLAERGDLQEAVEFGQQAVAKAEQVADPLILAEELVLLALTYRDLDLSEKAFEASQRAEQLYRQQGETDFAERARKLQQEVQQKLQIN